MSTLFLLCIFTLLHTSLAGPNAFPSTTPVLSDFLQDLPICATRCIEGFILTSFPHCPQYRGYEDIGCLCPSNSQSGLTLGEGALRCLVSSCRSVTTDQYTAAYQVCSVIADAQLPTHTVLSASIANPTTIALNTEAHHSKNTMTRTTMTTVSTSRSLSSLKHSTQSAMVPTTTGVILDSSATQSPTFSELQTMTFAGTLGVTASDAVRTTSATSRETTAAGSVPTAEAASATPRPILNKAQIAGVSVAGAVVGLVAIGLILFLFCYRKRKDRRRDSDASFGNNGDVTEFDHREGRSNSGPMLPHVDSRTPPKAREMLGVPGGPAQKRWTLWRYAMSKPPTDIGLAISSEGHKVITQESSPISTKSYHTTSRLLPDKPVFNKSSPPRPVQLNNIQHPPNEIYERFAVGPGLRVISPTPPPPPKSERRAWKEENTSQPSLQNTPHRPQQQLRHQPSDPFIETPTDQRALTYATEPRRASVKDLPRIITPANHNDQSMSRKKTQLPQLPRPQPPPHLASLVPAPLNPVPHISPLSTISPLLPSPSIYSNRQHSTTYTLSSPPSSAPPRSIAPHASTDRSQLPSQTDQQFNKYLPLKYSRRGSNKRPETYYTTGSDTSFEDENDEPLSVPAAQASGLSPVVESPASHRTPLSNIKYPAIPNSSAERYAGAKSTAQSPVTRSKPYGRTPMSPHQSPSPATARKNPPPRRDPLPPAKAIVELPERSSSKRTSPSPPPQQDSSRSIGRQGAKWQIICSPGLDGAMEVSGSPTVSSGSGKTTATKPSPKTPPEYKAGRRMHAMPRGGWID